MSDYPDWTELIQLVGSDIMLPIDIQGAYIMMPVDIQAQYITLEIDIVAQTVGNITIDIAAQTVGNLNVNIAASAVTFNVNVTGTVDIDITAQSVGIHSEAEWETKQGNQKFFYGSNSNVGYGSAAQATYTVTTGKTLYITHVAGAIDDSTGTSREVIQLCALVVQDTTAGTTFIRIGGQGGVSLSFPTPISIPSGHQFLVGVLNLSNHNCNLYANAGGYEV